MHHEAILYSLDKKIPFSQISDISEYDITKYSKLEEWMRENNVWAMTDSGWDFHFKLLPIRPRVHIIYYLGDLSLLNKKIIGIVGPRMMSLYGKQVMERVFDEMTGYDIVTISGMADGVDQLCHTLSSKQNIPTIAVLGWGIGRYLKRPERTIIEKIIAAGGLVISEYKLGEQPTKYTFPQRNRLIAWLADMVFLPEAGEKSWSLITVDAALAMKKPVYATPGSIFSPTSVGILRRIEKWDVKPIIDLAKFFNDHFISKNISPRISSTYILTEQEQWLLRALSHDQGTHIQDIAIATWWVLEESISLITMLEIKGLVSQYEPGKYILNNLSS